MTIEEIKTKLSSQTVPPDLSIINELRRFKKTAVENLDESCANELWCYEQIFSIKKDYYDAFQKMKEAACLSDILGKDGFDSPKSKCYEEVWNVLDRCDMNISSLEERLCQVKPYFFTKLRVNCILAVCWLRNLGGLCPANLYCCELATEPLRSRNLPK